MSNIHIVKLEPHHTEYLATILTCINEQHLASHGHEIDFQEVKRYCISNSYCMIGKSNELIGFCSLSRFDFVIKNILLCYLMFIYNLLFGRIFVYDVYILPQYRKHGFGKLMISLILEEAREKHWCVSTVYLHPASQSLVSFYEKCGFHLVDVCNSTIYMSCNLTS